MSALNFLGKIKGNVTLNPTATGTKKQISIDDALFNLGTDKNYPGFYVNHHNGSSPVALFTIHTAQRMFLDLGYEAILIKTPNVILVKTANGTQTVQCQGFEVHVRDVDISLYQIEFPEVKWRQTKTLPISDRTTDSPRIRLLQDYLKAKPEETKNYENLTWSQFMDYLQLNPYLRGYQYQKEGRYTGTSKILCQSNFNMTVSKELANNPSAQITNRFAESDNQFVIHQKESLSFVLTAIDQTIHYISLCPR